MLYNYIVLLNFVAVTRLKAIALLFIFSVSSFGHAVEVHYCKGELTAIAWMKKANCVCNNKEEKKCKHAESHVEKQTSDAAHDKLNKKSCCKTESVPLTSDDTPTTTSVLLPVIILCSTFDPGFFSDVEHEAQILIPYADPVIKKDIPILIQSFLI